MEYRALLASGEFGMYDMADLDYARWMLGSKLRDELGLGFFILDK